MTISRIFFFQFFRKNVKFFCYILFVKKINFEMFFRKEFFSVNLFWKKKISGTLFRKFSFHEKICFWNFLILKYFFSKEIIFQNFNFFRKKCKLQIWCVSGENVWKNELIQIIFLWKKIQNEFIWLLCTSWCQYTIKEVSKNQKNQK